MQSLRPNPKAAYGNVAEALYKMVRYEGVLRPLRGMSAVVIGAGPAHALYFSCYEKMKRVFSGTEHATRNPLAHGKLYFIQISTFLIVCIISQAPLDV